MKGSDGPLEVLIGVVALRLGGRECCRGFSKGVDVFESPGCGMKAPEIEIERTAAMTQETQL